MENYEDEEIRTFLGELVNVILKDGSIAMGKLEYVATFMPRNHFRHPKRFYIGNLGFKASQVESIGLLIEE